MHEGDLFAAAHDGFFHDADVVLGAEPFKVFECAPVDVGGVVPLVGHSFAHGHFAAECDLEAVFPVAEIGKGYDGLFAHAGEAAQNGFGVAHGLDGLAEYDNIETVLYQVVQTVFQIGLDDVNAA